ncbi:TPA: site-2 protease family protein [bacterium]|nr:site-2 protease family protein [bacterium]
MDILLLITRVVFNFTIFIIFATFHEYMHGWMAYRCGDSTAKQNGRLSLNPFVHIDPFWTIIMPAILLFSTGGRFAIGSAKPVPVNPYLMRNPKTDIIWVGLAGPMANVGWALILIALMKGLINFEILTPASPIYTLLFVCMYVNLILLVFNMLPVPPLDGSRIIEGLLASKYAVKYQRIAPYMFVVLIALMYFGLFGRLFGLVLQLIMYAFNLAGPQRFGLL